MDNYECWEIKDRTLEYFDDIHLYLVDGIPVQSITQLIGYKFAGEYANIDKVVLKRASEKGTAVHEAIERYCKYGEESTLPELSGFKTLKRLYDFEVLENETPVILEDKDGEVIGAGRLDLVLKMDGKVGGGDIKRTASLNKEKLGYQLNLYRIAYRQSYGIQWDFLKGLHLRYDEKHDELKRQMVDIPINEELMWDFIEELKNEGKMAL